MCRCMSGFTDEFYQRTFDALQPHLLPSKPAYYSTHERPSVWVAPTLVWEIRGADFTVSPTHTAAFGHVHADRGVSLRFPRFLRARDDKVRARFHTPVTPPFTLLHETGPFVPFTLPGDESVCELSLLKIHGVPRHASRCAYAR